MCHVCQPPALPGVYERRAYRCPDAVNLRVSRGAAKYLSRGRKPPVIVAIYHQAPEGRHHSSRTRCRPSGASMLN